MLSKSREDGRDKKDLHFKEDIFKADDSVSFCICVVFFFLIYQIVTVKYV